MSSLQKFHRRTNAKAVVALIGAEGPIAGAGFWMGTAGDGTSKMYVAPKSTEVTRAWNNSTGVYRNTNLDDGLSNTNTLAALGSTVSPAAYYAKYLTTGGYNTWYLPAIMEMITIYSNKAATPFATNDAFTGGVLYWSTSEYGAGYARVMDFNVGGYTTRSLKTYLNSVRAVRRSTV